MRDDGHASVLVLDSGIGGMTVVKAIRELGGAVSVTYISDNACFPYGGMKTEVLTERIYTLIEQALDRFEFDAVVIACNTASTVVLDVLRKAFSIPFIGVVPPIKTAGEVSRTRVIGLLATEGTVRGNYVDTLIKDFAADCRVIRVECPDLAALAEDKARGREVDRARLRSALVPLTAPELAAMDVVVLGCTHYPILRVELEEEFRPGVRWLDPARPVADRLLQVLEKERIGTKDRNAFAGGDVVFFTGEQEPPEDMRPFLEDMGFSHIACWPPISSSAKSKTHSRDHRG